MTDLYETSGTSPTTTCSVCRGHGEVAVPGTYGATISPERLETRECWNCDGEGEVRSVERLAEEQRWAALSGPCRVIRPATLTGLAGSAVAA